MQGGFQEPVRTGVSLQRALHLLLSDRSLPRRLLQPQLPRSAQLEAEELPEQPRLGETHHEQHQQPAQKRNIGLNVCVFYAMRNYSRCEHTHLTERVLKFPVSKSSVWFSERAKPKPTARNIRVSVIIRVRTNPTDHIWNLHKYSINKRNHYNKINKQNKTNRILRLELKWQMNILLTSHNNSDKYRQFKCLIFNLFILFSLM